LAEAGHEQYEVSNFSLSGQQCRHNINYWSNGPYLGIGPSAVSKLARRASATRARSPPGAQP
jgi:oxygen-independent coproporphyrinogen-3 oxidase